VHDLQGMGCNLEHFVVKWDQQYTEDEQACMGKVGIVVRKSDATVRSIHYIGLFTKKNVRYI